jgi:hypothetical protein
MCLYIIISLLDVADDIATSAFHVVIAAEVDRAQDEHEEREEEERTAMIAEHWHQSQSQLSSLDQKLLKPLL